MLRSKLQKIKDDPKSSPQKIEREQKALDARLHAAI